MNSSQLTQLSLDSGVAQKIASGALVVQTGKYTGRAVKDRFVVRNAATENTIDWGSTNAGLPESFATPFFQKLEQSFQSGPRYEYRGYVGVYPIEVVSRSPWHILFAENMFRDHCIDSLAKLAAGKTIRIFHDPYGTVSHYASGHSSETLILLDPAQTKVGIVGTAYAGEIKKSAFTLCNYLLPEQNILSMHASANTLEDGSKSCVLFGLSGTGKTTLSASPDRWLIGDDEIVWSPTGLSNLEGGCYAKLIDLKQESEPEIYSAIHAPGAILENVALNSNGSIDFSNRSRTENTRGSYPLNHLKKFFRQDREAQAPSTIVFLTSDAFGAMPACARLNPTQAAYHFISGYTAKVAGTEIGVKEPQATFSHCFGAPFMPRHPSVYAKLLAESASRLGATFWILNTGWHGGGYGKGSRYPIDVSRKLLAAIQSGALSQVPTKKHPLFGFEVPTSCPGVADSFLNIPEGEPVRHLAQLFQKNMERFITNGNDDLLKGGPIL
jgi:phosphoenolpyruvate carboxykinase (ATP)